MACLGAKILVFNTTISRGDYRLISENDSEMKTKKYFNLIVYDGVSVIKFCVVTWFSEELSLPYKKLQNQVQRSVGGLISSHRSFLG